MMPITAVIPNDFSPHFAISAFQSFQAFSLGHLLFQHVFHVQSQLFHRCADGGNLLDGFLQSIQAMILAVILFF